MTIILQQHCCHKASDNATALDSSIVVDESLQSAAKNTAAATSKIIVENQQQRCCFEQPQTKNKKPQLVFEKQLNIPRITWQQSYLRGHWIKFRFEVEGTSGQQCASLSIELAPAHGT